MKQLEKTTPVETWRAPALALLLGGLVLALMGQLVYRDLSPHLRPSIYLLIIIGLGAFVGAGHLLTGRSWPHILAIVVQRPAHFLDISTGQWILLLWAPFFALMAWLAAGESLLMVKPAISWSAWLLAVGCVLAGSYKRGEGLPGGIDRFDLLAFALLFTGAFLLRGVGLDRIPPTLSGDEGSAGLTAVQFLRGEANNIFTVGWFSFPSLYFAVQSLGILILGQTTEGLRMTSALAGALTVPGVYLLGRVLFDRTLGLLAAVYLMTFHYHIHFSRIGLNNIWDGLFVVILLTGLWYGWKTGRRSGFILCGLALGLGLYFYVSFRVFPLLLLIWAACAFCFARPLFKQRFPGLVLAAVIAFVIALPIGLFFWNHPAEFNAPLNRVTVFDGWLEREMERRDQTAVAIVGDQMLKTALGFIHEPLRHWYNPGSPLLLAGAATLFLLGLMWALTALDLRYLLILLPFLSMVILGGFSLDPPASQRYVAVAPLVALLVALPLRQVAGWLQQFWPTYQRLIASLAVVAMAGIMWVDVNYYFFEVYDQYVLGGFNTETATAVAHYLVEQNEPDQTVYFFGFPRMGYFSLSTIPYLAPHVNPVDVMEPLTAVPVWPLASPTLFIFLPERSDELNYVRAAYPDGSYHEIFREDGTLLFITYEIANPG